MRVGKTQSTIANKMRLLKLPATVKEALRERKITERHARAMLSMQDAKEMTDLTQQVIDEKLTVSQTEKIIAKKKPPKAKTKNACHYAECTPLPLIQFIRRWK